jgi:DNA polymerase-3 subunit gamma/tau
MTYIPLARKWRPKSFSDLIGQNHVVTPLQNSLSQNKLHHAYLFTGTRGVGKTTVARIFAKALNCQSGVIAEPCLTCDNCRSIDEGRFFDLIEVDGASRTRVEDTRELIENIQYAPAQGRFKIFLIDEVHMLSTHSFNALLKTLEEPPEHVKFLLATTDPQKIPATILSRCLQFNLNPITSDIIVQQLSHILQQEQFNFEHPALALIANQAHGSMRDAITLCEQLMAMFPDGFTLEKISNFMGHSLEDYSLQLMDALLEKKANSLLQLTQEIIQQQHSLTRLLHLLLSHFHRATLFQIIPNEQEPKVLQTFAQQLSTSSIHTGYQLLEKGLQELDWAPNPAMGFQMLVLRVFHALKLLEGSPKQPDFEPIPVETPEPYEEPQPEPYEEPEPSEEPATPTPEDPIDNWSSVVENLKLDGIGKTALTHTVLLERVGQQLILEAQPSYLALFTPNITERVENALANYFQKDSIKIKLKAPLETQTLQTPAHIKAEQKKQVDAELSQTVHDHAFVKKIISDCQAEIIQNSMTFNAK